MTETKYFVERTPHGDNSRYTMLVKAIHELPYGRWEVSITKYRKPRSSNQNRLLHAWFQMIAEDTGNDMETIKAALKQKFLTAAVKNSEGLEMIDQSTGEVLTYVRDTRDLNTVEFAEFTENVRLWAAEWGIILPLPGQQDELRFKQ